MGRNTSFRARGKPRAWGGCGAFLALSTLAVISYLAGSLARFASDLNESKHTPVVPKTASSKPTTWVQDYQMTKCKASQTHVKPGIAEGQTVLVTGAAGLIGQHVVRYCATVLGARVIAVDDKEIHFTDIEPKNRTRFLQGSLLDEAFVADVFAWYSSFDVVYYLNDHSSPTLAKFHPAANYKDNLLAGIHVLNGAILSHSKYLVYLSSTAVFGQPGPVYTEATNPEPLDPYGIAKYAMERQILTMVQQFDFKYSILRVDEVFGPGMELLDLADGTVQAIIHQAHEGKSIVVPSKDEAQPVSLSFVKDLAPLLAQTPFIEGAANQIINMGTGEQTTYADVAEALAEAFGNVSVTYDRHKSEMKPMQVSFQKMRCLYEAPERLSLKQAMNETAQWVRAHPESLKPRPSSNMELGKYLAKGVKHQLGTVNAQ